MIGFIALALLLLVGVPLGDGKIKRNNFNNQQGRVPGMTDREMYNQLLNFFANADPIRDANLIEGIRSTPMWIQLNAEFGSQN